MSKIVKWQKIGWYILLLAILFNLGAFVLTHIALSSGTVYEANPIANYLFNVSSYVVLLVLLIAYTILVGFKVLLDWYWERFYKKYQGSGLYFVLGSTLLPTLLLFFMFADFGHNFLLMFFGNDFVFEGLLSILPWWY